jgi:hypothetical protein
LLHFINELRSQRVPWQKQSTMMAHLSLSRQWDQPVATELAVASGAGVNAIWAWCARITHIPAFSFASCSISASEPKVTDPKVAAPSAAPEAAASDMIQL